MKASSTRRLLAGCIFVIALAVLVSSKQPTVIAGPNPSSAEISIPSSPPTPPTELNPQGGGAPKATFDQAADFSWQEFIALNWPAGPQQGNPGQRDTPSSTCRFGDPACTGPLVWQTFRGKVEIFPGNSSPLKFQAHPDIQVRKVTPHWATMLYLFIATAQL